MAYWTLPARSISHLCLSALLTGLPLVPLTQTPAALAQVQAVPAEVRRGYTLLGQGLVNDAIAVLRQAVQRYPASLEAKLGLAIAYRRAGRDADAWQAYQQVLVQDPNNQLALKTVGILGGFRPEWQPRGIDALTTLLTLNPDDAEGRAQRALLFGYQGRFAESLADYEIALQRNPTPQVLLGAAQIYTYSGNARQGLELFNRYRAGGGTITGTATIAYARALRSTGNPALAVQVLQAQLPRQLTATAIQLRSELSQAYLDNRQPTEALAVLDPLRGRSDSRLPLARALNELGQRQNLPALLSEAAGLYRQVLSDSSNSSPTVLREAADVLSGIPQERQYALQLYRQLVQQQPTDRALALQRLALEAQLGYLSKAELRQQLRSLLQPLPADRAQQAAIAQALVRVEPDVEFLPVYQSLLQAGVDQPFLYFRLAQLLIERNDLEGAKTALAAYQATPSASGDTAPELLFAEIDRRQGNLTASAQRYQALLNSRTTDADVQAAALRGLAGIRLTQGRSTDALALYDQLLAQNPQDLQVQLGRASVAYQAKRISATQAEAVLNTWLQNRPASATPPELYSLVAALPPSPQRESLYTTLIEADPTNLGVQVRLVQVLASRNPAQAQAEVNRLLARSRESSDRDSVGLLFLRGQLAQASGNFNQADEAYQRILQREPENADALSALGGVRFQQRQFDSATQLYSQVLALKPDDPVAQRSLAELAAAQGRPLAALQQLEQLQVQQTANSADPNLSQRIQQIQENLLQQRGFQPPWERY
ncbi:tetratricopeptide repeat protein [Leptolyngbya sp. FACHB-36]|uniref:tetratricopeptide repeat protein n=1 Tax=Leptolyngbya sp. FACHB-36 TaxID=2692808 RepID=UPI0016807FCC|nr:tetratricopeptide repeat protein [Leptolyngbya sp. FACHB-36]MBD2019115.1 tetratricopeptide repeat protein [Leptolyngbya sp. FACHB-36]